MTIDHKKLALIHIIKKELDLSDKEYRNILHKAAGVRSAKDLDQKGFRKLMNYFVRSRHYKANAYGMTLKQKMFIKSLARQLDWDQDHLDNFIHKYYHKTSLNELSKKEASLVIESLKHISEHQHVGQ